MESELPPLGETWKNNQEYSPQTHFTSRLFKLLIAVVGIIGGTLALLAILIDLPNIFGTIDSLSQTSYLYFDGVINAIYYFLSRILTLISSILFIISGVLIILKKAYGKKLFIGAFLILTLNIVLTLLLYKYQGIELKKSEKANQQWLNDIQKLDKSTITDISTIWGLKEPELCKNIKDYHPRMNCIRDFPDTDRKLFTLDYCTDLGEDDKNLCMADVAGIQKDKKICYTIPNEIGKNYCLSEVATSSKDISACAEVSTTLDYQQTCISNTAMATQNPLDCEMLRDISSKDRCISTIATDVGDKNLCQKVVEIQKRQQCISYIERNL